MNKIFTDAAVNTEFMSNGFIKVKLLSELEVKEVIAAIERHYLTQTDLPETLSVSLWSDNLALKQFADNLIKKHLSAKLTDLLCDYEPIWGDILIKRPHLTKEFGLHQDWTFVDESQYTSVNVWCPLQDVNYWNGCLQVVRKSHLFLDKIRGLNIHPSYSPIGKQIKNTYAENISCKMGEAVIFSHALLHSSTPNRTFKNRMVIGLNLKPLKAPIIHYLLNSKNNRIEEYVVQKDYFLQIGQKTSFSDAIKSGFNDYAVEGTLTGVYENKGIALSLTEFDRLYNTFKNNAR